MPINASKPIVVRHSEIEKKKEQIEALLKSSEMFLIYDGKIHKISKKSKYLIDMLTLED